jgi:DNA-binding MarR family transcriptional regulator
MDANNDLKAIQREIANSKAVKLCAKRHGTIGDLTAMKICYLFRHHPELSVSEIAELVKISVSAASRQLKKLKEAEILQSSKHAQTVYYSMQQNNFTDSLLTELNEENYA